MSSRVGARKGTRVRKQTAAVKTRRPRRRAGSKEASLSQVFRIAVSAGEIISYVEKEDERAMTTSHEDVL
jgi:hypothetical protein